MQKILKRKNSVCWFIDFFQNFLYVNVLKIEKNANPIHEKGFAKLFFYFFILNIPCSTIISAPLMIKVIIFSIVVPYIYHYYI